MKKKIALTLLVLAIAIFFIARSDSISFEEIIAHFKTISPKFLLFASLFVAIQFLSQAYRLFVLIPTITFKELYSVTKTFSYGQVMNHWLPARAGDIFKLTQLIKLELKDKLTKTKALLVLATDRIAHLISLIVLMLITNIVTIGEFLTKTSGNAIIGVTIFLAIAITLFLLRKKLRLEKIIADLKTITFSKRFYFALIASLASWACEATALIFLCQSLGFALTFSQAILVLFTLSIGISVPVSVANIGPYEASITFALTQTGVEPNSALTIALAHHMLQTATLFLIASIVFVLDFFLLLKSGNRVGPNDIAEQSND